MRAPKRSLVGGEIDPDLHYASDLIPVISGAELCRNFIVRGKGGVERLPGTEYLFTAKTDGPVRLGVFRRSSGIAYLAEYGENYVRLRDASMHPVGAPFTELVTSYTADLLPYLQWVQSKDVQWIFSGLELKELQRFSANGFQLVPAEVRGGPFLDLNYGEERTIAASAVEGASVTLKASAALFEVGHVGALWRLHEMDFSLTPKWEAEVELGLGEVVRYNGNVYEVVGAGKTSVYPPSHTEGVQADGTNVVVIEDENDPAWPEWGVVGEVTRALVGDTSNSVSDPPSVFFKYLHSGYGLVRITGVTDGQNATAEVISRLPVDALAGTSKWQEGAWSDVRGYPICGALYKDALWAGGTEHQPSMIWKSAIEGYDDWEPGILDDSSLSRPLNDGETETVRWMAPGKVLTIGTDGPEWVARPESSGDTVRVKNLITEIATDAGSSAVPGISISGVTVFPDTTRRALMSLRYDYRKDSWDPEDLSLLASHLLGSGIVELEYQRTPWPVFWCLLQNGKVAGLTYLPKQNVLAWHLHDFGDPVESIAVAPVDDGRREALFVALRRAVGAGTEVHVERMFDRFRPEAGDELKDARFLFGARFYDGEPRTVFGGLDHLEGREVIALVDGYTHPPMTVENGQVTLEFEGSKVLIGARVASRWKSLPFDFGAPDENQAGRNKAITDMAFVFRDTMGGEIVVAGEREEVFPMGDTALDQPPELFTGVRNVPVPGSDDTGQYEYVNDTAWPATITAVFPEYEV